VFQLKKISDSAIEAALEKVERYRLLNEPQDAESICRDVLAIDPDNQPALVNLVLALTDQFERGTSRALTAAREAVGLLKSEYEREYYSGIIWERQAKAALRDAARGSGGVAYDWLRKAMDCYERAEKLRTPGNDEAALRWNTCARLIMQHPHVEPEQHARPPIELE
jgi:tetratricopeptide (TPR) repeat protein